MSDVLMLDTNVFNHVLNGDIPLSAFDGKTLVATHIQRDEIQATPDATRRNELLRLFGALTPEQVPTESAVWDVSKWGRAKWGREDGVFEAMKRSLDALNNDRKGSNAKDILIAETALRNGWTLVTNDRHLTKIATDHRCNCIDLKMSP